MNKIKLYFHMWFLFVTQGLNASILNNMFVNKRKESVRTLINSTQGQILQKNLNIEMM